MTETTETETTEEQPASEFAQAWRPSPGDIITGKLLGVELIDPNGNGAYPCVALQTSDGERNVHAFHSVLRRELARKRPKIGDEITITYQGQREGGRNGTYHAYRVVGGQGLEFDWDSQLPPEERQSKNAVGIPIAPAPVPSVQEQAAENFGDDLPF